MTDFETSATHASASPRNQSKIFHSRNCFHRNASVPSPKFVASQFRPDPIHSSS